MRNESYTTDELIVVDRFHLLIVATGEIIPSFAGGDGGGGGSTPPPPSSEERQAYAKQAEASDLYIQTAKKQQATAEALEPYFYKQLGLTKKQVDGERERTIAALEAELKNTPTVVSGRVENGVDQDGNTLYRQQDIVNPNYTNLLQRLDTARAMAPTYTIEELPPDATELQRREIQDLANKREIAALKGDLPVDPSVEQDIQRGESQLNEELARRGIRPGSGDIYTRAIAEYQRGANALRYGVRRGEMTSADALATNRQMELQRKQGQYVDQARGGLTGSAALLNQGAGLYGDISRGYRDERMTTAGFNLQDSMAAGQGRSQMIGAGIGGGAMIVGATAFAI